MTAPSDSPSIQGKRTKPAMAVRAPIAPRSLAPTQTAMPTMFGPGISWQRVRVSANSWSSIHCRCSTTTRRAQMRPPPKPHTETLRKARNNAPNPTSRAELVCGADLACLIRYLLQTWRLADGVRTAAGESFAVRTAPPHPLAGRDIMIPSALRLLMLVAAVALPSFGLMPASAQDEEIQAMAAALKDINFTLQDALKASEKEGQPISAQFEID